MNIDERINHFKEYLKYRLDIIGNNPNWWLGKAKYQLPTFEYYLQNCINDKGGKYDFTKRQYRSPICQKDLIVSNAYIERNINIIFKTNYSYWMGTPFNFKDELIYKIKNPTE